MWHDNEEYTGGVIGFGYDSKEDSGVGYPEFTDLIRQLNEKEIINRKVFYLEYKDDYNGILYIGDYFKKNKIDISGHNFITTNSENII